MEDCNCNMCGGEGVFMGALGDRNHFRCRQCGLDFSRKRESEWTPIKTVQLTSEEADFLFPNLPECDDPDCEDCQE